MGSVLEINAESWETDVLKSDIMVVVDFWHEHCPWCIRLNPIFEEISEGYKDKAKFAKLNVLKSLGNREVALKYGVMSTPTLKFFCKGRPVGEAVGFMPREHLKKVLDDILVKHQECVRQSTELKI